jgi:hypothetical protein
MEKKSTNTAYGTKRIGKKTQFWIGNRYFTLEPLSFEDDPAEAEAVTEFIRNALADGLAELAGNK